VGALHIVWPASSFAVQAVHPQVCAMKEKTSQHVISIFTYAGNQHIVSTQGTFTVWVTFSCLPSPSDLQSCRCKPRWLLKSLIYCC